MVARRVLLLLHLLKQLLVEQILIVLRVQGLLQGLLRMSAAEAALRMQRVKLLLMRRVRMSSVRVDRVWIPVMLLRVPMMLLRVPVLLWLLVRMLLRLHLLEHLLLEQVLIELGAGVMRLFRLTSNASALRMQRRLLRLLWLRVRVSNIRVS